MSQKETPPLYKRLMDDLKTAIDTGEYKKGELLPSENELCKIYDTTRATVRLALTNLTNSGYITRVHGKGSIVSEPKKGLGILSLGGVTQGVGDLDLTTILLQKQKELEWPSNFFYPLNKSEQRCGCIYFTRLRCINGTPVLYEETYVSNNLIPGFISQDLTNRSLFEILKKEYKQDIKEGEQKIWAKGADKKISDLLHIATNTPIVHMKRRLQTSSKDLNVYSFLYCNTDEYFLQDQF